MVLWNFQLNLHHFIGVCIWTNISIFSPPSVSARHTSTLNRCLFQRYFIFDALRLTLPYTHTHIHSCSHSFYLPCLLGINKRILQWIWLRSWFYPQTTNWLSVCLPLTMWLRFMCFDLNHNLEFLNLHFTKPKCHYHKFFRKNPDATNITESVEQQSRV